MKALHQLRSTHLERMHDQGEEDIVDSLEAILAVASQLEESGRGDVQSEVLRIACARILDATIRVFGVKEREIENLRRAMKGYR